VPPEVFRPPGHGRLSAVLIGVFNRIAIGANALGTLVVLVLVIVMNFDVAARGIFNAPFRGVVEVVIFSMILIVFLQLPDVVRVDRLTRSDGFMAVVGERYPALGQAMRRSVDAISCVFMALAAYASWPAFAEAFESCSYLSAPEFGPPSTGYLIADLREATVRCDYFGTPGIFTAPWWPVRLVIVLSAGLAAILFLFKAIFSSRPPQLLHAEEIDRDGPL
jgi:hypothetical protein